MERHEVRNLIAPALAFNAGLAAWQGIASPSFLAELENPLKCPAAPTSDAALHPAARRSGQVANQPAGIVRLEFTNSFQSFCVSTSLRIRRSWILREAFLARSKV